ncbi:MAG: Eco57I restriction-modification methylase domain-containing protein [Nanoarchaeota archaeon]|nr:Eco57I restriction-modification methylase domain-containing protein [Nanoarchaeota archaeon]MCG2717549.1 Eco57I restriction-modification methylase domain-containing protein [Nanoarchaeota archaeon]
MAAQMAFDTTSKNIKTGDYQAFQETVTNIISGLTNQINKKDLNNILTGKHVLTREIIKNQYAPEAFTKHHIIVPLLIFLGYKDPGGKTEAGEVLGEKKREIDYKLPVNNDMILLEAESLNHDLTAKGHGVAQVTEWLSYKTVETDFGVATNGFEWVLLKWDNNLKKVRILKTVNLLPLFRQKAGFSTLDAEINIENIFSEFYSFFAFYNIITSLREIDKILIEKREEVSKQFYNKYIELVFGITKVTKEKIERCSYYLLNVIKTPSPYTSETEKRKFVVTFMNRVLFIKFLEDKQLAPPHLLKQLYKRYTNQTPPGSFYKTYIAPLFYNVLNTPLLMREKNVRNIDLFQNIPYLNGGLFRENIKDEKIYDVENDIVEKIIKFIEEYDFTLSTTLAISDNGTNKGALDPDILGYVFEKTINFLTGEGMDRKKMLGAYYTPDEITTYISKNTIYPFLLEKIKEHLKKKGWKDNDLQYNTLEEILVKPPSKNRNTWEEILNNIVNKITILDPACGSGHFLTSALKELLHIKEIIYHIMEEKNYDRYHLKWEIIANNLFGVDIEGAATEIAKLRLWLSLIEDLKIGERDKIEALPNIEFNIREGNSLIGWLDEDLKDVSIETCYDEYMEATLDGLKLNYMKDPVIRQKIEEAEKLLMEEYARVESYVKAYSILHDIYPSQTGEGAVLLHKMIEGIRKKIYLPVTSAYVRYLGKQGIKKIGVDEMEKLSVFHWKVDFGFILNNGGFDVVIGNPPYIQKNAFKRVEKSIVSTIFKENRGNMNTAAVFINQINRLNKETGYQGMIVPKSLLFSKSWLNDRKKLLKRIVKIVDVSKAFKDVLLEQVIYTAEKRETGGWYYSQRYANHLFSTKSVKIQKQLTNTVSILVTDINEMEIEILNKLRSKCFSLGNITKTFSGFPYQSKLTERGDISVIGGKEIGRYFIKGIKGYFTKNFLNSLNGVSQFKQKKIVSQRIVAHVTKPKERIIIMSSYDDKGVITVNTVSNTILTDNKYNLKSILLILNAKITSWFAYRFIYAKAIRGMDLYDYFIGKILIPNNIILKQHMLEIIADYLLTLHKISFKKGEGVIGLQNIEELTDCIVCELYMKEELKTKLIELISPLVKDVSNLKTDEEKLKIINNFMGDIKSPEIQNEIEKIKTHKWVKNIMDGKKYENVFTTKNV